MAYGLKPPRFADFGLEVCDSIFFAVTIFVGSFKLINRRHDVTTLTSRFTFCSREIRTSAALRALFAMRNARSHFQQEDESRGKLHDELPASARIVFHACCRRAPQAISKIEIEISLALTCCEYEHIYRVSLCNSQLSNVFRYSRLLVLVPKRYGSGCSMWAGLHTPQYSGSRYR